MGSPPATVLTFTLDKNFAALVFDRDEGRYIGTAFVFLQPHWAVTAKHVVFRDGLPRRNLGLSFAEKVDCRAELMFAHPTVDLAVLKFSESPCKVPLYPAHHAFAGSNGLISVGYKPSRNTQEKGPAVEVNSVPIFAVEKRELPDGEVEELVVFDGDFVEGGHSGGPVLGTGGGVVGVVIERSENEGEKRVRATSIEPLLRDLTFAAK